MSVMILQIVTLSFLIWVSVNIVRLNSNPKKGKCDRTGKENSDVEYTLFRNEIIKNIAETEAISMSELENLMKIKINKP